jgi:hypothetical protein
MPGQEIDEELDPDYVDGYAVVVMEASGILCVELTVGSSTYREGLDYLEIVDSPEALGPALERARAYGAAAALDPELPTPAPWDDRELLRRAGLRSFRQFERESVSCTAYFGEVEEQERACAVDLFLPQDDGMGHISHSGYGDKILLDAEIQTEELVEIILAMLKRGREALEERQGHARTRGGSSGGVVAAAGTVTRVPPGARGIDEWIPGQRKVADEIRAHQAPDPERYASPALWQQQLFDYVDQLRGFVEQSLRTDEVDELTVHIRAGANTRRVLVLAVPEATVQLDASQSPRREIETARLYGAEGTPPVFLTMVAYR